MWAFRPPPVEHSRSTTSAMTRESLFSKASASLQLMYRSRYCACIGCVPVIIASAWRTRSCSRVISTLPTGSDTSPTASPGPSVSRTVDAVSSIVFSLPVLIASRSTTNSTMRPGGAATVWPACAAPGAIATVVSGAPEVSAPAKRANSTCLGFPATVTEKSAGCRSVTGCPVRSTTAASTVRRSMPARKVAAGCCGRAWVAMARLRQTAADSAMVRT